jgi:hypothetical protein
MGALGGSWGWIFIASVAVLGGLYLGLGMIVTRGKLPVRRSVLTTVGSDSGGFEFTPLLVCGLQHADFWADFVALVRDGMWWSIGMKGEVTISPRIPGRSEKLSDGSSHSARRYSDLGHASGKATKKSSRKDRKRKERKGGRYRRASLDSAYGATGQTQPLQAHRPQADDPNADTVAALFARHGVGVHTRAGAGSKSSDSNRAPSFVPPQAGWTSAPRLASHDDRGTPDPPQPLQAPSPTIAAPVTAAAEPAAFPRGNGAATRVDTAVEPVLQQTQQQSMMTASVSAPSLSALRPAGISLVASSTSAPSSAPDDDDTITPRTRRIGNFARRQAGAGGYTAGVSAAPVRLLPQGKRK